MAVNWSATEAGTHDLDPSAITNKDSVFRASSTTVECASPAPQGLQIVLYSNGILEQSTAVFIIGPTPRRFRIRAPKHLDYSSKATWRYIVTGPARLAGLATFTVKSALDTLLDGNPPSTDGPSTSHCPARLAATACHLKQSSSLPEHSTKQMPSPLPPLKVTLETPPILEVSPSTATSPLGTTFDLCEDFREQVKLQEQSLRNPGPSRTRHRSV